MRRVISILFILILFFAFAAPIKAANGSLYLSPSSGAYTVGNTFLIEARVNTGGVSINAAQGTLVFPPDKLSVVGISKNSSIFSLWTAEPTYSNSSGTISFEGGVPNPGYTGSAGKIITITFRSRVSGTAQVNWSSGAVLANDGKGTNILANLSGGAYTLGPTITTPPAEAPEISAPAGTSAKPEISSSTHPDENKWYNTSTIKLSWTLPKDVAGVSILLNEKPTSNPGPLSDGLFDSKTYENVSDGISYLHIKFKNDSGWGAITHYKIQIDTTPPRPFNIETREDSDTHRPVLYFEAKDDLSGIDHYKIRIRSESDESLASIVNKCELGITEEVNAGPYKFPSCSPEKHIAVVEAFDKAGNSTASIAEVEISGIASPQITEYPKHLSSDENLIIKGTSASENNIKIYILKEGMEPITGETKADKDGKWTYIYDKFLTKGAYKVFTVAIDSKEVQSYPSESVVILVALPAFFKIGSVIINYLTAIIALIGFIALMVFGAYWSWHRFTIFRKKLIKETEDIDRVMKRSFDLLKEDVKDQFDKLNKVRSKRELNEKEKEIESQLKKDIDIAEKYIRREVEDVEKKLKIRKK
jgi:hypothetical protein